MHHELTHLLASLDANEPASANRLLPIVYDELRKLADRRMAHETPGHTLSATALVHEAYLRLVGDADSPRWQGRGHFFAAAAEAMRRILVDNARRKQAARHGGKVERAAIEPDEIAIETPSQDLLALDEALQILERDKPEHAELVKLRFFAGLTSEQAAEVLGISPATAERRWTYARAWLRVFVAG